MRESFFLVRVQCLRLHAVLLALALACFVICLAETAGVREMHVRLDVIGRKVAGGASMPACGACACVGACPIIATVFEIRASATPLYEVRSDMLAWHQGEVFPSLVACRRRASLLCLRCVPARMLCQRAARGPRLSVCVAMRIARLAPRIVLCLRVPRRGVVRLVPVAVRGLRLVRHVVP